MRKLFLLLAICLLGVAPVAAQNVVFINTVGPFKTLGIGVNWTPLNTVFMYTPSKAGACLYVTPNPVVATAHSAVLAVWQSGDPTQGLASIGGDFSTIQTNGKWAPVLTGTVNVPSNAANPSSYWINTSGAAIIGIVLNGGVGAGTFDLFLSEGDQGCSGGSNNTRYGGRYPYYCDGSASAVVATGTTVKLLSNDNAAYAIHVCTFNVTISGAAVARTTSTMIYGTGATCGTGTVTAARYANGATDFSLAVNGAGGELYGNATANGKSLCYTDGGTTAGSTVNITYSTN